MIRTGNRRPRPTGRAHHRWAPDGSAAGPADGDPTNGRARPATTCTTRRTSCGSPCAGGCATRSAAATSLRCCSNGASPSPPRRSGSGRAASRRVPGRGRRAGRRALVRSRPRHRPGGRLPGRQAQRAPRHGRRAALPAATGGRGRAHAAAHHDGPASTAPEGDPLDPREEGPAPMPPGLEHPHRAQPPGGAAALRPHAGLRKFRVRRPLLFSVR